MVTAVLGSYRGYDTFGEVVVIFAAGLGVLLLLGLNGNAGHWQASPSGQRISAPSAPAGDVVEVIEEPKAAPKAKKTKSKAKSKAKPKVAKRGRPKVSKNKPKTGGA